MLTSFFSWNPPAREPIVSRHIWIFAASGEGLTIDVLGAWHLFTRGYFRVTYSHLEFGTQRLEKYGVGEEGPVQVDEIVAVQSARPVEVKDLDYGSFSILLLSSRSSI